MASFCTTWSCSPPRGRTSHGMCKILPMKRANLQQKRRERTYGNLRRRQIEIYIPEPYVERLRDALHLAQVGRIGNNDHCLSLTNVWGDWRPLEGASPFQGQIAEGTECKVEGRCERRYVSDALKAIRQIHPYDEPLIHVIPLASHLF